MSDLSFGVTVGNAAEAMATLQRIGGATQAAGAAAVEAQSNTAAFGQRAQQLTQHVGSAANAIASLTARLGNSSGSQTAGLIGSTAASIAQFTALGAQLGPQGALVGGIVGAAVPAFEALARAQDGSRAATERLSQSLDDLIANANTAYQRMQQLQRLEAGGGTAVEQAAYAQEAANRVQLATAALAGDTNALRELRAAGLTGVSDTAPTPFDRLRAAATGGPVLEISDSERQALETVRQAAIRRFEHREELIDQAIDSAAEAVATGGSASARRSGGGGRGTRAPSLDDLMTRAAGSGDVSSILGGLATDAKSAETEAYVRQREQQLADLEKQRDLEARAAEATRAHAEAQRELSEAAMDAQHAFSDGYVTSIDQVVAAYQNANRAIRAANGEMLSSGRLLERGMVAAGNNIAETVGGTMKGAFESALGAWLDGSKSFVEAAEAMARGVLKALVTEAIVQGVVELARGIADLASYHYDSAGLHFAAAAAWAAVGAVAGGVGAAVGAFGGAGAGQQGAVTTRDTASASRERDNQSGGNATFYIYPGGFITRGDMEAALVGAINSAGRRGYQISREAVRGSP